MNISHFLMCIFVWQLYWNVTSQSKLYGIIKNWFINVHLLQKFQFRLHLDKISEGAGTHMKKMFFFSWETLNIFHFHVGLKDTYRDNRTLELCPYIKQSIRDFTKWLQGQTRKPNACLCSSTSATTCYLWGTSLHFSMPHTFTFF